MGFSYTESMYCDIFTKYIKVILKSKSSNFNICIACGSIFIAYFSLVFILFNILSHPPEVMFYFAFNAR